MLTIYSKRYYGIALAEDKVGKETMKFLALLLLTSFSVSVIILVLLSFYLSSLITSPITKLTREVENISPGKLSFRVFEDKGKDEVVSEDDLCVKIRDNHLDMNIVLYKPSKK